MKSFLEYRTALVGMTVREALDILRHTGDHNERVIVPDSHNGNKAVSVSDHCATLPMYFSAADVYPMQFSGGPPDNYFWVNGSLFDMVIDKLMYRDAIDERRFGTKVAQSCMQRVPTIRNLGC